jgi:hypothetical protein
MLSVVIPNVFIPNVVMPSVVMLRVVILSVLALLRNAVFLSQLLQLVFSEADTSIQYLSFSTIASSTQPLDFLYILFCDSFFRLLGPNAIPKVAELD